MSFRISRPFRDLMGWFTTDWYRFLYNLTHIFSPAVGWRCRDDLSHSYVNVCVTFFRAIAYLAGHIVAFAPAVWLASKAFTFIGNTLTGILT